MASLIKAHIHNLRNTLLKLEATGENGFEGLIGIALDAITGIPFRLAKSGYQRGVDGKSAFEGTVAFEGKLYNQNLPRADVLSKLPDFIRHNDHGDLVWVLGASCIVPSQLADDLREDGAKEGVSVFILDWTPSDFPRLAVALAMGGDKVEGFLTDRLKPDTTSREVAAALAAIRADTVFSCHAQAIREELYAPGVAIAMAKKANVNWFEETLSKKALARSELGQPLAPKDTAVTVLDRIDLVKILSPYFTDSLGQGQDVICVHGEEGCGKSWVVIQSWLAQSDKPLLVFATPDDFPETDTQEKIESYLIKKLIAQTGDVETEKNVIRWRCRLRAWKNTANPSQPRLILIIDGINQRPARAWSRIIDNVATYVNWRGGRVIFSARTHYFNMRVKRALNSELKEISVSIWRADERNEILKHHNVPLNKLNPSVAEFLRNPRILSIAVEVFGGDVAAFEELSIERLLFEHIRAGVKENFGEHPADFITHLRTQAKELSERATAQVKDDLQIFEADVPSVAEGRFYCPVPGEPKKYELREEGLTLALGFSIIENLRKAERNNHNLDDILKSVIEPIEALDKTAEAVTAAITVCAADDDEYSPAIARALTMGFADLQNPPSDSFFALVNFARARSLTFAETARDLSLQGGRQSNFDWIQTALVNASQTSIVWSLIVEELKRWLRAYSLMPERRMCYHAPHDPQEKVVKEHEISQAKIDKKLAALSDAEKSRQERLVMTEGDLDALSRLALLLLAGKELEAFADELVDWSFANALNGSFQVPTKDFLALIALNHRDWQKTRRALLRACKDLSTDTVSNTGRRARLMVLRATGAPDDDRDASILYEELIKNHQLASALFNAEEKIEPCDPSVKAPTDLSQKIDRYQNLNINDVRKDRWPSIQDYIFDDDRAVIARFALETATAKHREFASDVAKRTGMSLRQGLFELREHGALVTEDQARALIARWNEAQAVGDAQGLPHDESILLQYELLIAFPFLDSADQIEILLATTDEQPLLLELVNEIKTPSAQTLEQFAEEAVSSGEEHKQFLLLEIAADMDAEIGNRIFALAYNSLFSPLERLRSSALGLAARSGHIDLLKAVVESNWTYDSLRDEDGFENWYGSLALLKAAQAGLVRENTILDRISPRLYGRAALMLKGTAVQEIALRIDAAIRCAADLPNDLIAPEIELEAENAPSDKPTWFSISERKLPPTNIDAFFKRLSESDEECRERRKYNYDAFIAFKKDLTTVKAQIIFNHFTCEEFTAVVAADLVTADCWCDLFMELNDSKIPAVHNLILLLACAIAESDPEKSSALLDRTVHSRPLVQFTFGKSGVDLESISAWTGNGAPALTALRRRRLDNAATDQAIAVEVSSALQCGKECALEAYVDEQLLCGKPAEIARGIMIAGFCDQSPRNDKLFEKYRDTAGLPGKAYTAAIAAYRSNAWARHWFGVMCKTHDPAVFWQAQVLFIQCVDDRFSIWGDKFEQTGASINAFRTCVKDPLQRRYEKLKKEREKTLFGQDAPAPVFVHKSL